MMTEREQEEKDRLRKKRLEDSINNPSETYFTQYPTFQPTPTPTYDSPSSFDSGFSGGDSGGGGGGGDF